MAEVEGVGIDLTGQIGKCHGAAVVSRTYDKSKEGDVGGYKAGGSCDRGL